MPLVKSVGSRIFNTLALLYNIVYILTLWFFRTKSNPFPALIFVWRNDLVLFFVKKGIGRIQHQVFTYLTVSSNVRYCNIPGTPQNEELKTWDNCKFHQKYICVYTKFKNSLRLKSQSASFPFPQGWIIIVHHSLFRLFYYCYKEWPILVNESISEKVSVMFSKHSFIWLLKKTIGTYECSILVMLEISIDPSEFEDFQKMPFNIWFLWEYNALNA